MYLFSMSIPALLPSLLRLPVGINGISVCLSGIGALFRVFIPIYSNGSNANEIIILLLSLSLLLASLYILKCILHFHETISSDWNLPLQIGGIGSLSIAFAVQGSLFNDPVNEPSLSLYWLLFATAFIAFENIIFLRSCIINNVPPEPVYNTSVFNCFFVPSLLPSNPYYCIVIRDVFFVYGLAMTVYVAPVSMYRLLFLKDDQGAPLVVRNPTCAIQQAVFSVSSTAWLVHPISFSGVSVQNNQGVEVIHTFFALSQVGYIVTIIAIWQRRSILWDLGYHPTWAAFTFPFVNTAITTSFYRKTFPTSGIWLDLLVFYHVIVALSICSVVATMYVMKGLLMFPAVNAKDVDAGIINDDFAVYVLESASSDVGNDDLLPRIASLPAE